MRNTYNEKPVTLEQQNAQLISEVKAAKTTIEASTQACREYAAKATKAEQARDEAEYALKQAQKQIAELRTAVTPPKGESPFVQVGSHWHLISSIRIIETKSNGSGIIESVNGQKCVSSSMPVEALLKIVADYKEGRPGPR